MSEVPLKTCTRRDPPGVHVCVSGRVSLDAVERMWHAQDSQGQIPALAFTEKPLQRFKMFLRVVYSGRSTCHAIRGRGD